MGDLPPDPAPPAPAPPVGAPQAAAEQPAEPASGERNRGNGDAGQNHVGTGGAQKAPAEPAVAGLVQAGEAPPEPGPFIDHGYTVKSLKHRGKGNGTAVWRVGCNAGGKSCVAKDIVLAGDEAGNFAVLALSEIFLNRAVRGHPNFLPPLLTLVPLEGRRVNLSLEDVDFDAMVDLRACRGPDFRSIPGNVASMVFEELEHDLEATIHRRWKNGPKSERRLKSYTVQMCLALAFLHDQKIVHCDFKPENIMLKPVDDGKENMLLCLIDLGVSVRLPAQQPAQGTLEYAGPEVILEEPTGTPRDVLALGIVVAELYLREKVHDLDALYSARRGTARRICRFAAPDAPLLAGSRDQSPGGFIRHVLPALSAPFGPPSQTQYPRLFEITESFGILDVFGSVAADSPGAGPGMLMERIRKRHGGEPSPHLEHFLERALDPNPASRADAKELLRGPYLEGVDLAAIYQGDGLKTARKQMAQARMGSGAADPRDSGHVPPPEPDVGPGEVAASRGLVDADRGRAAHAAEPPASDVIVATAVHPVPDDAAPEGRAGIGRLGAGNGHGAGGAAAEALHRGTASVTDSSSDESAPEHEDSEDGGEHENLGNGGDGFLPADVDTGVAALALDPTVPPISLLPAPSFLPPALPSSHELLLSGSKTGIGPDADLGGGELHRERAADEAQTVEEASAGERKEARATHDGESSLEDLMEEILWEDEASALSGSSAGVHLRSPTPKDVGAGSTAVDLEADDNVAELEEEIFVGSPGPSSRSAKGKERARSPAAAPPAAPLPAAENEPALLVGDQDDLLTEEEAQHLSAEDLAFDEFVTRISNGSIVVRCTEVLDHVKNPDQCSMFGDGVP
ncbi:kinase-like domain-containing protein [Hyaloraphidium curvatum]|nr:kinase-like domain-containing protein [Hyaloraphidium curvatum]